MNGVIRSALVVVIVVGMGAGCEGVDSAGVEGKGGEGKLVLGELEGSETGERLGVWEGDLDLGGLPEDWKWVKSLEVVTGTLVVRGSALTSVKMPLLRAVGGLWVSENWRLERLRLPRLEAAGDVRVRGNRVLREVSLPVLGHARGIEIRDNGVLEALELPELRLADAVEIEREWALREVAMPLLVEVGGRLRLAVVPQLEEVTFPLLRSVQGAVEIEDTTMLRSLALESLEAVTFFSLQRAQGLQRLELPELLRTVGGLAIRWNPALRELWVPLWRTSGRAVFSTNAELAEVQLPRLSMVDGNLAFASHERLTRVELPALRQVTDELCVLENRVISEFPELPELASAGSVRACGNPGYDFEVIAQARRRLGELGIVVNPHDCGPPPEGPRRDGD